LTQAASDQHPVLRRVADGCALAVIGIGLLAMAGWLFGIDLLTRVLPHLQSMKLNTALCFVLSGAALWCRERPAVRIGLGVLVISIGALTLGEYLSGADFGIDQLFVRVAAEGQNPPGRMSPATALCFLLSGTALVLMRSQRLAEALALGAAVVGGFALLGYALGSERLYHVPGFVSVAVHTATAFVFLGAGILCALSEGVVALLLRSRGTGRTLWLGFGVLTFLLAATTITSVFRLASIEENLTAQTDVARRRSAAAEGIAINVLDYALRVREHLDGEVEARSRGANAGDEVARHLAAYKALTETAAHQEQADRFAVLWRELHTLGEALMETRRPVREELARFAALRSALAIFLDEELRRESMAALEARRAITLRDLQNSELLTVVLLLAGVVLALLTSSAVARTVLGGQAALRESHGLLRLFIEHAPAAIAMFDREMRYLAVSTRWKQDYHLQRDILGRSHYETFPEIPERWKEIHRRCLNGAIEKSDNDRFERSDGSVEWLEWEVRPWFNSAGEIGGIVIFSEDITGRKLSEEALRESEVRMSAIMEGAVEGIITIDDRGSVESMNPMVLKIFGYEAGEVIGRNVKMLMPAPYAEAHDGYLENYRRSGEKKIIGIGREVAGLKKDGTVFPMELAVTEVHFDGKRKFAGFLRDVTERKAAEAALRASEERLRQLLRVLPVAVYTCDADGLITFFNDRAAELWGCEPRLGNPQDRFDGAFRLWWPDGSPLPHERSPMAMMIRDGHSIHNQEVTIERPDGSRATVVMNIDPTRAPDGSITGAINAFADYTELRRAEAEIAAKSRDLTELKRAEAEIAAKSRDLEMLLYVTSHDLREPLRAIENFSRLIQERYADRMDEKGQDFLQRIIRGAKRLDQLLLDILTVSRAQRLELPLEEVSTEDIVRDVLGRLETRIQETGAKVRMQEGLPRLQVDRTWATQAIYNLVVNALKFTRDGEPPDVEIAPYFAPEDSRAIGIAVCDRGPGVAPEQAERIFDLFQRAVGREIAGTGAGLAIVKQVGQRHGGDAWLEPRAGGGSKFIVTFAKTGREEIQRWTPNP
jgi:PAS domain S-box-containing protein